MEQQRLERLESVNFFMKDLRVPPSATRILALFAVHNLMTGFFQNSEWQVAWYCFKKAVRNSWENLKISVKFFYWKKILRLSESEIDKRIDKDCGVDEDFEFDEILEESVLSEPDEDFMMGL